MPGSLLAWFVNLDEAERNLNVRIIFLLFVFMTFMIVNATTVLLTVSMLLAALKSSRKPETPQGYIFNREIVNI